jgi:meso-butanediol dehydrogenase / (S,S)-butanediol dehydrogenase / diacetyl reductase
VDINATGLDETARTINDAGGSCARYCGDLGQPANCANAVNAAIDAYDRLDVLCNVAGILRFHALADVTTEDWHKLLAANVTAPFFMMQAAMPHLVESKGNIVNVASTAAFIGQSYTAPYAATKAALLSLTKSLAMEFIKSPVRINAIAPGGMMTEMVQGLAFPEGADTDMILRYCGFRPPNTPEDIVEPLIFLASDRARAVHGACYTADNGITAG